MDLIIEMLKILIILFFGIPLSIGDIKTQRVPLALTIPALGSALLYQVGFNTHSLIEIIPVLVSGLAGFFIFFFLHLFTKGGVGLGDGLISAFLAVLLGFLGWITALLTASLSALLILLSLLFQKKVDRKTPFPFAPFLFLGGTLVSLFEISKSFKDFT